MVTRKRCSLGKKNCSTTASTRAHYLIQMRAVQVKLTTVQRWSYTVTTGTLSAESVFSQQHEEKPAKLASHESMNIEARPACSLPCALPSCAKIGFNQLMTRAHIGTSNLADFSQSVITYLSSDGSQ